MKKILFIIVFISTCGYAQLHTYRYKQELQGVTANAWHKLTVPDSVMGKLQSGYADLRIYGVSANDTIEMPYLVDKTDTIAQKRVFPISVVNFRQEKQTNIKVRLPYPLRLSKVSVSTNVTYDYYRTLNLVKDGDVNLLLDVLSSKKKNVFSFPTQLIDDLQVIIVNNDNEPLPIAEVGVYVMPYTLKVRFGGSEYAYFLAYSKDNDYMPTYDITHFAKEIPNELTAVEFGRCSEIRKSAPAPVVKPAVTASDKDNYSDLLWGLMGLIVALIFVFAVRMLKPKK